MDEGLSIGRAIASYGEKVPGIQREIEGIAVDSQRLGALKMALLLWRNGMVTGVNQQRLKEWAERIDQFPGKS